MDGRAICPFSTILRNFFLKKSSWLVHWLDKILSEITWNRVRIIYSSCNTEISVLVYSYRYDNIHMSINKLYTYSYIYIYECIFTHYIYICSIYTKNNLLEAILVKNMMIRSWTRMLFAKCNIIHNNPPNIVLWAQTQNGKQR